MKRKPRQANKEPDENAIIRAIILEAVALDREISQKEERLKECKAYLALVAANRPNELLPTNNGGKSWRMEGEGGCAVNVAFPAPILKSDIEGDLLADCRKESGKNFGKLLAVHEYAKPVADFRSLAISLLGAAKGAKLIAMCEGKAPTRVSFETKAPRNPA